MTETRRAYNFGFGNVETTVTSRGAIVDSWVRGVTASQRPGQDLVVGLDCEWRPNTTPTMNNRAATLQLCVGSRCIIVQLLHLDYIPASLSGFLGRYDVVCVGVEVDKDVEKLSSEYGITCARTGDLKEMALNRMPYRFTGKPGLKTLAQGVIGLHMPKPKYVARSDWATRYLDEDQMEYACLDAYASCMLGMRLR